MYRALIRLMCAAVLLHFGKTVWDYQNCRSRQCGQQIQSWSRDILKTDWKPVSIWPEEAKRFR